MEHDIWLVVCSSGRACTAHPYTVRYLPMLRPYGTEIATLSRTHACVPTCIAFFLVASFKTTLLVSCEASLSDPSGYVPTDRHTSIHIKLRPPIFGPLRCGLARLKKRLTSTPVILSLYPFEAFPSALLPNQVEYEEY